MNIVYGTQGSMVMVYEGTLKHAGSIILVQHSQCRRVLQALSPCRTIYVCSYCCTPCAVSESLPSLRPTVAYIVLFY
jgi:hypothetical protein